MIGLPREREKLAGKLNGKLAGNATCNARRPFNEVRGTAGTPRVGILVRDAPTALTGPFCEFRSGPSGSWLLPLRWRLSFVVDDAADGGKRHCQIYRSNPVGTRISVFVNLAAANSHASLSRPHSNALRRSRRKRCGNGEGDLLTATRPPPRRSVAASVAVSVLSS